MSIGWFVINIHLNFIIVTLHVYVLWFQLGLNLRVWSTAENKFNLPFLTKYIYCKTVAVIPIYSCRQINKSKN